MTNQRMERWNVSSFVLVRRLLFTVLLLLEVNICVLNCVEAKAPLKNSNNDNDEDEDYSSPSPAPSSSTSTSTNTIESFRDNLLIPEFQKIVSDIVSVHQGSWIRHVGLHRDGHNSNNDNIDKNNNGTNTCHSQRQSHERDSCNTTNSGSISNKDNGKSSRAAFALKGGTTSDLSSLSSSSSSSSSSSTQTPMLWDDEHEIPRYFQRLASACSEDPAEDVEEFQYQCWEFLQHLIHHPRCTVRMDSRTICSRGNSRPETITTDELLAQHFANNKNDADATTTGTTDTATANNEALHIVILGGGPVGLVLANALTQLQKKQQAHIPDMRIVIIENRIHRDKDPYRPQKLPYARDWVTDIVPKCLYDTIDPRISNVLRILHDSNRNIALPINALETLLLLSNRNSNVKFLYGEYSEFEASLLMRNKTTSIAPNNLLVWDATGHKLQILDRRRDDNRSDNDSFQGTVTITDYTPESNYTIHKLEARHDVGPSDMNLLAKSDQHLEIAYRSQQDTETFLSYPVLPSGSPYTLHFIKILNFPLSPALWSNLLKLNLPPRNNPWASPVCTSTGKDWCGPHFMYEMSHAYNPNIRQLLLSGMSTGFAVRGIFSNLTPDQATELVRLIKLYGNGNSEEISLVNIPLQAILDSNQNCGVLRTNNIDQILSVLIRNELEGRTKAQTKLSVFQYRPYIYTNPVQAQVVPPLPPPLHANEEPQIMFGGAPLLRIGDSLLSGDVNASTGLLRHLQIIATLMCRLQGATDDCDYDFNS